MAEQVCITGKPIDPKQYQDVQKFAGVRLPTWFRPIHYNLVITPNLDDFVFSGQVDIEYELDPKHVEQKYVYLHYDQLKINNGSVVAQKTSEQGGQTVKRVFYDDEAETCIVEFTGAIPLSGTLTLHFTGILNDELKGFYRTKYTVGDKEYFAATTQFEATDGRRCLPCVDEPAAKATFSVTIIYKEDTIQVGDRKVERVAISNTPVLENGYNKPVPAGFRAVAFQKTPKMSTYLLAFTVGHFEYIEESDGKRPVRVYTTPGKSEQGRYALDVACKSIRFYEQYFDIPYPLAKMDLIAIPDFASGAMENWGLVTYRETRLLVDPNNTSTLMRQYVALVVTHELAHQWFGNLVTMEWWTDLWLNEGFATFMEFLCTDYIFPDYDIWSQFITDNTCQALDLDSLHNSHPIEVEVKHPCEIREIFDAISYSKGSAVIRMMYNYIGDEHFRKGMKDYLTKFSYKNASTCDLWQALEAASGKPIGAIMSLWTKKKGFPWISVTPLEGGALKLEQSKFTADGKLEPDDVESKWMIPLSLVRAEEPTKAVQKELFTERIQTITVDGLGDAWVKLNPGSIDFYRTVYPESMLQKLIPAIREKTLPPIDRLSILSDYFALCQAGKVGTVELLKLLEAFSDEDHYTVWSFIDSCFSRLDTLIKNTDYQELFHSFGIKLYMNILKKVTWNPINGENYSDKMTRALVIDRLISFGQADTVREALSQYQGYASGTGSILPDLRPAVYMAVSKYGDDASFDSLFELHKKEELQEEKNRIAKALGRTKAGPRLDRVMQFAMSDQVRSQDKIFVICPFGVSNPIVAWKFFQENKDKFREIYGPGFLITYLVKSCTSSLASKELAQEVESFFKANSFPGTAMTVEQSLERIRLNAAWLERDASKMKVYLESQSL